MKKTTTNKELLLGAHMSVAGGLYTAFERAERVGCTAIQIFTKNSNQWNDPVISTEDIAKYREGRNKSKVQIVVSHDSYLINLCGANDKLLEKSREAFVKEIKRCDALEIRHLIFHPGAHTILGRKESLRLVADSLNYAHKATEGDDIISVIETTAGQGTTVGSSFEEIAEIISGVKDKKRVGVCIDTCHIFAAGYDIRTSNDYEKTMSDFDKIIGFEKLHAVHLNDAKKPLNSHVDRHEHIGKGEIGKGAFGFIMNDDRFSKIPKILETPKGENGYEMDIVNLRTLRELVEEASI
ncbi:MAG: deoxyribonuclease IV [Bacteroidetes bacterium]|nr:deoxyribonuclease IV [Bacteroidota bacterium]MCL5737613.1 deoxyribonuclease IV [Bacteroidota bacterium]